MCNSYLSAITLLITCFVFSGCSFSTSSESISTSIDGISTSIDGISTSIFSPSNSSSSSQGEETIKKTSNSFNDEVTALTILYVGSSDSTIDFQRELGQIASSHGINDWANSANTFKAIGDGLKRAKVSEETIASLPFLQGLKGSQHYYQVITYAK